MSRIVRRMKSRGAATAQRPRVTAVSRSRAVWRALGDWRAVLAGTAVLGVAVLLGPLEAGVLGFAAYRVFREPLSATFTDEEALVELSESVLQRVGKTLVGAASRASFALYVIEAGGIVYFGYRIVIRWRSRRRDGRTARRIVGSARR